MEPRSRPRQFRVQGASWSHSSDLRFGWYGTASINPRVHMTILGCLSDLSIWSIKNIFIQMSRLILTTALWDVGEGGGSSSKGDFAAFQKYSSQLGGVHPNFKLLQKASIPKFRRGAVGWFMWVFRWEIYYHVVTVWKYQLKSFCERFVFVRLLGSCRARSSGPAHAFGH